MRARFLLPVLLVWPLFVPESAAGQSPATSPSQSDASTASSNPSNSRRDIATPQLGQTGLSSNEIIERVFKREKEQDEIIAGYSPIVETYIQTEKTDPVMGTVPKSDFYFLGIADFRGKEMKVHSMTARTH